jgi:serine protease AprX
LNIPGNCFSGLNNFTISPNPTQSQLTIRLTTPSASENITVRIFNILGQAIVERKTSKVSGLTIFEIPVSQLPEGKYFVSVYDNNIRIGTQSLIKLK